MESELQSNQKEMYTLLKKQVEAVLEGEHHVIPNLANASALLNEALSDINWVGFYLLHQNELLLGPFQGKPACTRIPVGRGVCGSAVARAEPIIVPDVHAFPGHIACDAASRSEVVVPLFRHGALLGVFDLDSPEPDRFDADDQAGLEALAQVFLDSLG